MKEIVDLVVGGEETLSLPRRLEALHLSLSPLGRLVRILCPPHDQLTVLMRRPWLSTDLTYWQGRPPLRRDLLDSRQNGAIR